MDSVSLCGERTNETSLYYPTQQVLERKEELSRNEKKKEKESEREAKYICPMFNVQCECVYSMDVWIACHCKASGHACIGFPGFKLVQVPREKERKRERKREK